MRVNSFKAVKKMLFVAFYMLFATIFVACGSGSSSSQDNQPTTKKEPTKQEQPKDNKQNTDKKDTQTKDDKKPSKSENSDTQPITNSSKIYSVKVIDGYILEANVKDSSNNVATYNPQTKAYDFAAGVTPRYPLFAVNGYFEHSKVNSEQVLNLMNLKADNEAKVISPLSTFITDFPDKKEVLIGKMDPNILNVDYIKNPDKNLLILNQYLYTIQTNSLSNELNQTLSVELDKKPQDVKNLDIVDVKNATINAIYESDDRIVKPESKAALKNYIYKIDEVAKENKSPNLFEEELAQEKQKMQENSKESQMAAKDLAKDPKTNKPKQQKEVKVDFEPANYSENSQTNIAIKIIFSNDLNLSLLESKDFNLSSRDGKSIEFDVDTNVDKTITLRPKANLSYDTNYILILGSNINKVANGRLSNRVLQFTTTPGVVRDSNTGLTWEDKADTLARDFTFDQAQEYCKSLGDGWRIPTNVELESIVDFARSPMSLDIFKHIIDSKQYWSSTPYVGTYGYGMSFKTGTISSLKKTSTGALKCVNGQEYIETKPTCQAAANKTVKCSNNLIWKDESQQRVKIDKAEEYCQQLGSGFRLPTYKELKSIYNNKNLVSGFKDQLKGQANFWTSTKKGNEYAVLSFRYGDLKWNSKSYSNDIRCVTKEEVSNQGTQEENPVTVKPVESQIKKFKKLPQTGQMASYDNAGKKISDSSIKDDYFYKDKGLKAQFTRDAATGIVVDHLTGLQWQDDASANEADNKFLRRDFSRDYCKKLTIDGGGWRLPNYIELQTIVDHGKFAPAMNEIFQNVSHQNDFTYQSETETVEFYSGEQLQTGKNIPLRVRCVRGEKIERAKCIRDDSKKVVTCDDANLMWQDNELIRSAQYVLTWERAIQTCEDLNFAGFDDWRLPNVNELNSIVNNPAIKNGYNEAYAWSSTTDAQSKINVWTYRLNGVYQDWNVKTYEHSFRCVRSIR